MGFSVLKVIQAYIKAYNAVDRSTNKYLCMQKLRWIEVYNLLPYAISKKQERTIDPVVWLFNYL